MKQSKYAYSSAWMESIMCARERHPSSMGVEVFPSERRAHAAPVCAVINRQNVPSLLLPEANTVRTHAQAAFGVCSGSGESVEVACAYKRIADTVLCALCCFACRDMPSSRSHNPPPHLRCNCDIF